MATPAHTQLEFVHAFGVARDIRECVAFHTDAGVLYPVGRHVAVQNTVTNAMHVLPQSPGLKKLLALQICPKQRYLAVCERVEVDGVTSSQISVFDLRTAPLFQKMRTLTNPVRPSNGKASDIIGCAFSGDSKFLACQTGRPDWTVMIWHWFQSRVICSVEVPARVSRVTFNPVDSSQICTSGPSHFRLWRVMDEALRPFPPFAGVKGTEHIVDHDWTLDDRLVAVTERGTVLVIDECELRQAFPSSHISGKPTPLLCIKTFGRGFIVGGHQGAFALYELPDDGGAADGAERALFRLAKTLRVTMNGNIVSVRGLSLSPSKELAALCVDGGVGTVNLSTVWLMKDEDTEAQVNYLVSNLHTSSVVDLSVCHNKPLFATCSSDDKAVRVWDYDTKKVVVSRTFDGAPQSVSLHPSGYLLLTVTSGRVAMMHLLSDELKPAVEMSVKGAQFGRFSNGGGLYAVACLKHIHVYSTYGGSDALVGTLLGHVGHIMSITWTEHDVSLVSCAADGAVYIWNVDSLSKGARTGEAPMVKGARYTSLVSGPNSLMVGAYHRIVTRKRRPTPIDDAPNTGTAPGASTGKPLPGGGGGARVKRRGKGSGSQSSGAGGAGAGAGSLVEGGRRDAHADEQEDAAPKPFRRAVSEEVFVVVGWPNPADPHAMVESKLPYKVNRVWMTQCGEDVVVFGGLADGTVAEIGWPLSGAHDIMHSHHFHSMGVTGLAMSGDGCFMFSAGADGSIFMVALSTNVNARLGTDGERASAMDAVTKASQVIHTGNVRRGGNKAAEAAHIEALMLRRKQIEGIAEVGEPLVLVPAQAMAAANYRVKQALEEKSEEVSSYKMKMELENQRFAEEQASQELHFQAEREVLDKQVTTERNDRLALKKDLEERLERQEKQHMAAAEELISLYEKKLSLSVAKYEELQQQYADLKTAAEAKHAELLATNTATQNHILSQFKHKVATQRKAHADLKSYLEYVKTQYNEMLAQQDREHDQEVLSLKSMSQYQDAELHRTRTKLKGEQVQLQQAVSTLKESLETANIETAEAEKRRHAETQRRQQMADAMKAMQAEVKEIQGVLVERDNQLADSHRKIRDLERSRRVLQQQLQDLRAALVPHDREIGMLKDQIKELDEEYDRGIKTSQKQEQVINDRTRKVQSLRKRLKEAQESLTLKEQMLTKLRRGLETIVTETPPNRWRSAIRKLHESVKSGRDGASGKSHGGAGASRKADSEEGIAAEFHRQRDYLERSIRVLKNKAGREESKVTSSSSSRFAENGMLLVEINALRKENKGLAKKSAFLEAELNAIRSQQRISAAKRAVKDARAYSRGTQRTVGNASSVGLSRGTTPHAGSTSGPYHRHIQPVDVAGGARTPLMSYNRAVTDSGEAAGEASPVPVPTSPIQENRSLTLDVRIPSTVITDGDEDEGDADAGGTTPALASKPAHPAARDGAAPAAKEGEEKEKLADSVGSGGGEPENARERELMRSLRRREVEVAQLMNSARESRRTMAAQQAEIERLQQHVLKMAAGEAPTYKGFSPTPSSPNGPAGFRPFSSTDSKEGTVAAAVRGSKAWLASNGSSRSISSASQARSLTLPHSRSARGLRAGRPKLRSVQSGAQLHVGGGNVPRVSRSADGRTKPE